MSSSQAALTVVFAYRDRDLARVRRSLDSLARQTFTDFRVIFVDYGSSSNLAEEVRLLVEEFTFCEYVYSEARGLPWNRSHALNTGVRRASSEFVMTTDIDMIFPAEFLATVVSEASAEAVLYCYHHFLPKGFSEWKRIGQGLERSLRPAGRSAFGACQVVATEVYRRLRGFDEYYRYWGIEDRDLHARLLAAGLKEVWLNDRTALYHQWHEPVDWETAGFMPDALWPRMQAYYHRSRGRLVRNTESWGRVLTFREREVFGFLDLESRRVLPGDSLVRFDRRCGSNREAGNLVSTFWDLPPHHAVAVYGASFPSRRASADRLLRLTNGLLRLSGSPSRIGYPSNVVHSYLAELLETARDQIADIYLDFPAEGGVSLLLRGPSPELRR